VLRHPVVHGQRLTIEGEDGDSYVAGLVDDAPYSDEVLRLLEQVLPEDGLVVDVGANVGIHSIAASRLAPRGQVHAFEPNPVTVGHLTENVRLNGADNVSIHPIALGESPGELTFCSNDESAAASMVIEASPALLVDLVNARGNEHASATLTVNCETLDDALSGMPRIDLVKIDTEGHDIDVLRGAKATLERCRPAVIIEFSTYLLTMHAQRLPHEALAELRATFDRLFVLESDGTLREIASNSDALDLLHENAVVRPVQDLVGVFSTSSLLEPVLRRAESPGPRRSTELRWLHERTQALEAELIAAQGAADSDRARVEEANARAVAAEVHASAAQRHLAALERTRTFRWTRQLRGAYSWLRTNAGRRGGPTSR
jgi:FkbM family methyltransferase